jgi:hypothetical protein
MIFQNHVMFPKNHDPICRLKNREGAAAVTTTSSAA